MLFPDRLPSPLNGWELVLLPGGLGGGVGGRGCEGRRARPWEAAGRQQAAGRLRERAVRLSDVEHQVRLKEGCGGWGWEGEQEAVDT